MTTRPMTASEAPSVGEPMSAAVAVLDGVRGEAVIFDWDGTAVPDRSADASQLRSLVIEASRRGLNLAVARSTVLGIPFSSLAEQRHHWAEHAQVTAGVT